ncbi:unnamed protein product [Cuscuta epithymum]|uniref:Uncharacterized protein n=1 Tax=Cuscuta epithymum TaxID=186058 RepID=A0AAV0CHD2_9ASTE|nr:unnamed protein product [Cuscuta epithymum]CAH9074655.1 unnamed protein product [Cuscuta epithymum]
MAFEIQTYTHFIFVSKFNPNGLLALPKSFKNPYPKVFVIFGGKYHSPNSMIRNTVIILHNSLNGNKRFNAPKKYLILPYIPNDSRSQNNFSNRYFHSQFHQKYIYNTLCFF